ncbi:Invasion protein IalB, involved in pathogenesis [Paracoccus halophilus]|uniref:Invasion protein n=1 Tax=Paracoccus halophilus TaxID=376733 RepID=A0A099F8F7_9RHOB|nr:invasion associated locus B family protein [Paracoccus halophilus]KGJ06402.1 invasion protein [Paracoccus halophilus]SFA38593.1 Invasion protein IalB, involved in pathogenesis [Paracoccus halophilus]
MAKLTSAAILAALFTLAGGAGIATAQEAAETSGQPAAEAPAAEAMPAEAPAAEADADANAEPKIGEPYAKETHGAWTLRCMRTESGSDPCELYQLLKDPNDSPVAEASVIPMAEDEVRAVITFIAPLETELQAGLGLQIDSGKEARYPFMLCTQIGCISRIGLSDAEINPLKGGNTATVSLLPFGAPKERMVKLPMSLSGFTAGMNALVEANKDGAPAAQDAPAAAAPAAAAEGASQ